MNEILTKIEHISAVVSALGLNMNWSRNKDDFDKILNDKNNKALNLALKTLLNELKMLIELAQD